MVSSSPQDEKQKNLKYKLKELVIRFTYHTVAMFLLVGVEYDLWYSSEYCKNESTFALLHL